MIPRALLSLLIIHLVEGWTVHTSPPEDQLSVRRSGDNLMVICSAEDLGHGYNASVEWYRVDENRPVGNHGRIMTITKGRSSSKQLMFIKPTVNDSGSYRCVIEVSDGVSQETQEKSVVINFMQAAKFVNVKLEQHPEEGKEAEIVCRVDGNMSFEIFWQFNRTNIVEGGPRNYELRENGQVLIIPVFNSELDDGDYQCNVAQFSSFESVNINVTAYSRPLITVFEGPKNYRANEGTEVEIKCQAVGKPKPIYKWTKNTDGIEEAVNPSAKYLVEGGLLKIQSVNPSDAGSYTCTASNDLDDSSLTLKLVVFSKPRIEKMENLTVALGEAASLRCRASGDGKIEIKWIHQGREFVAPSFTTAVSSAVGEDDDVQATSEGFSDEDAGSDEYPMVTVAKEEDALSLNIEKVAEENAGHYVCVAQNEAGSDRRSLYLAITHEPRITSHSERQRAFTNAVVELVCEASAVPEPKWTWKGPRGTIEADGTKFVIESGPISSILKISGTSSGDYGDYLCIANNGVGSPHSATIQIVEIFKPKTPSEIDCHEHLYPNYGECDVQDFTEVDESQLPTHLVFLIAKEIDVDRDFDWLRDATNQSVYFEIGKKFRIRDLEPKSRYEVRVLAQNEAGASELSRTDFIETTAPWAPDSFTEVSHDCVRTCSLWWKPPNDHGSQITSYRVVVRELLSVNPKEYADEGEELEVAADESKVDLSLLKPSTDYEVSVSAVNAVGNSTPYTITLRTSEYSGEGREMPSLSSVRIIIAAACVLLFVLLVIDLICFATNRCGLLACFCVNCLGRNVHSYKGKDVEQGSRMESNRLLSEGKPEVGISGSDVNGHRSGSAQSYSTPV